MRRFPTKSRLIARLELALVLIILVAAAVRIWSLDFGLPHRYHVDEPPQVLAAMRLAQGDLRIDYPPLSPNLQQLILMALFAMQFAFFYLSGVVSSPLEFAQLYQSDPTAFYLLARGLSVTCSLLALIVLYVLVRQVRGRRTALLACVFLALSFLDVRQAHFAKLYPMLTLAILLCIYSSVRYHETGDKKLLVASGILSGLAVGLRYSAFSSVLIPIAAVILNSVSQPQLGRTDQLRKLVSGGLLVGCTVAVGVVVGAPSLILNTKQVLSNMGIWAGYALSSEGFEGFQFTDMPTWQFYLRILEISWGIPILLTVILGTAVTIARFRRAEMLLYIFPTAYGVILLLAPSDSAAFARYLVPLLPFLALLAAEGTLLCVDWLLRKRHSGAMNITLAGLTAALVIIPSARIIQLDRLWSRSDTRTIAKSWIETHIPEGTKIAEQWHAPPLSTASDSEPNSRRTYDVTVVNPFDSNPQFYSVNYYTENDFEYLVLSSFIYQLKRMDPVEDETRAVFYNSLEENAELVAEFRPSGDEREPSPFFEQIWGPITELGKYERPGPTIRIYKLQ